MQEKTEKKFSISEIIAYELVSLNSPYEEQDSFHGQPMSYQAAPRLCISIRETFFNSISLAVIDEYDQSPVMKI